PGRELIQKLDALEEKLHNPKAQVTYDILAQRGGAKLYSQLSILYEDAKQPGIVTQGLREVYAERAAELQRYDDELHSLLNGDLAKLNDLAKSMAVPNIIVGEPSATSKKP